MFTVINILVLYTAFLWHGLQMLQHMLQDNSPISKRSTAKYVAKDTCQMMCCCPKIPAIAKHSRSSEEVVGKHIHLALYGRYTVVFCLSILISGGRCGCLRLVLCQVNLVHQLAALHKITRVVPGVVLQSGCPSRTPQCEVCKEHS